MPVSKNIEPGFLLLEVLSAWDEIHKRTSKIEKNKFLTAKRFVSPVQKQLGIISENLKLFPAEAKKKFSHIPIDALILEIDGAVAENAEAEKLKQLWTLCKKSCHRWNCNLS